MSLFDSASLVVTPNGYKAGKLYSIKPSDGAGDLDVVRATSATRVNANGLIEIPRTNLLLRSEEFDNAYWVKLASTISANNTIAPNGLLTADKLVEDTSASTHRFISTSFATTSGVVYSFSIFLKKDSRDFAYIRFNNSGGDIIAANINLTNGTVSQLLFGNVTIIPFDNDWFRVIGIGTSTSTSNGSVEIRTSNSVNYSNYTGDGTSGIFIWGAQLEVGNVATEYIPTTSVIRTRFAGITQDGGSANNIPRLDYTNASCPSILVEPQRTNLLTYSEDLSNVSWAKTNTTINSNTIVSPDGNLTADGIYPNNGVNFGISFSGLFGPGSSACFSKSAGVLSIGTYTFSFFIKKNNLRYIQPRVSTASTLVTSPVTFNILDLQNKTLIFNDGISNVVTKDYSNDFVRYEVTFNVSTSNTYFCGFWYWKETLGVTDGTLGYDFFGAQLEAGANATSYIPTVASAMTRNADVISKSGISSLINSEEGCFFVDFLDMNISDNQLKEFSLSDGTVNNIIRLGYLANAGANFTISCNVILSNVTQFTFSQSFIKGVRNKILLRYKQGEFSLFRNGVLLTQQNSGNIFGSNILSQFHYSRNNAAAFFVGNVNSNLLLPYLTNQQCIELTTL